MKIAIIGRSQLLFETAELLLKQGFEIPLIITAKEAPEYSKTAKDFEELARSINAEYIYTPKINLGAYVDIIKKTGPIPLAVSINYTGVISQEVIDLFELGILNAHAGDLPRYRGNAPLAWAILNKEQRAGLCIHKMIGGELDSGNILAKDYIDIDINTRVGDLFNWIEAKIPVLMLQAIKKLKNNPGFTGEIQSTDPRMALRGYPRRPEDGKIIWSEAAESIIRLINASSEPFSGAFCIFNDKVLKVWRAVVSTVEEEYLAVPGQVIPSYIDNSVDVACGSGRITLLELEYEDVRTDNPKIILKTVRSRLN
jgi:methionyl-tRNA formyltransferase